MVAIYVDDLLLFVSDLDEIEDIKSQLNKRFDMKDLGEAHYCLGIQISRNRHEGTIQINQSKYIEDILKCFEMTDCKAVSTPMDSGAKLINIDEDETEEIDVPYQSAVGSIMYAMLGTCPDVSYAVGAVSRFNSKHGQQHWMAVKRIL